jgi:hypothetical protein
VGLQHGDKEFLIRFPSFEGLDVVDVIQVNILAFNAQLSVSAWKPMDVPHKVELEQVHVEGVPHTVHQFFGLWVVGSLTRKTLDVDLLSLRRKVVVRILVAMFDSPVLGEEFGCHGTFCCFRCCGEVYGL